MMKGIQKKIFTTNEYHNMAEPGILKDGRLELVKGEIINMAPVGSRHAACVKRLNRLFSKTLSDIVTVSVQDPVAIGNSEPLPDIALLKPRPDFYAKGHPESKDILLIIEVADISIEYDRDVKLPLYASAGIREVWIVNLEEACVEVYTTPSGREYKMLRRFCKGDFLTQRGYPDTKILVDEILG